MVKNLVKNGRKVVAFDISQVSLDAAKANGASTAASVAEVASSCETVVTMLPSTNHVEATFLEASTGLLANFAPPSAASTGGGSGDGGGGLFIDCSTIDPNFSKKLHESVSSLGHRMLDAPVSGGVGGAEAGTLTFMAGGEASVLEAATPLLMDMGQNVIHCGGAGTGEVAKLCNNLSLGVSMIGTCEAMNLGVKLGIDPKVLAGVINSSTGRCWSSEVYNPCPGVVETAPANRAYQGGFANALMEKDLFLATQAARESEAPLPLASAAHAVYSLLKTQGNGDLDFSSVYAMLQGTLKSK